MSYLSSPELARAALPHQPWVRPALGPIFMRSEEATALRFVHLMTSCGTSTWIAATDDERCVALTFRWSAPSSSLLYVADTVSISSNLYVMGQERQLRDQERLEILTRLVNQLPWQEAVREQAEVGVLA